MSQSKKSPPLRHLTTGRPAWPGQQKPSGPTVAQPKSRSLQSVAKQPVAPPVYRPQPAAGLLQAKTLAPNHPVNQKGRTPVAPAVYRPQPTPKVLQPKTASGQPSNAGQAARRPVAPPVYRPEPKKIVQPRMSIAAQPRTTVAAAPTQSAAKPLSPNPHRQAACRPENAVGRPFNAHEFPRSSRQEQGLVKPVLQAKGLTISDARPLQGGANSTGANTAARVAGAVQRQAERVAEQKHVGAGASLPGRREHRGFSNGRALRVLAQRSVVQAKWFYEDNPHSAVTSAFYGHQRDALNQNFEQAITALNDNATQQAARNALTVTYGQFNARPAQHVLAFVGTAVFLDNQHGAHKDRLGSLADDQDASMYIQVARAPGDQNQLYVNKATGETYVKDTNNLFTPRFQSRSITHNDRDDLNRRATIKPAIPGGNRTPLEHVGGVDSQYLSLTAGSQDVTNAQGTLFNAPDAKGKIKGRVIVDLLQVDSANIVDLHVYQGARAELGHHMGGNIRDNFQGIWDAAHTEVAGIHNNTQTHQGASAARPATMNGSQTQQWQQILDAVRTKEVLIAEGIPFDAVTAFQNSSFNLSVHTNTKITEHNTASTLRTQAAAQARARHRKRKGLIPAMAQELKARVAYLKTQMTGKFRYEMMGNQDSQARTARKQQLIVAETPVRQELTALADFYQTALNTGVFNDANAVLLAFRNKANALIYRRVSHV